MSRTRQVRWVAGSVHEGGPGTRVHPHGHPFDQLVSAPSGVVRTTTSDGTWVLPPTRALLVPARVTHEHAVPPGARLHTLLLAGGPPRVGCELLVVTRLARELIATLVHGGPSEDVRGAYLTVLVDQLRGAHPLDLGLPLPDDPLLRELTGRLLTHPEDPATLVEWGRRLGASDRTLARRFRAATGLGFDGWRRRARMLRALELLAEGRTVSAVAHAVGYGSAPAFVHAFRRVTGTTPGAALGLRDGDRSTG